MVIGTALPIDECPDFTPQGATDCQHPNLLDEGQDVLLSVCLPGNIQYTTPWQSKLASQVYR